MTQTERVLAALQESGTGVCGVTLEDMRIPRYAARIRNLKDKGYRIEKVECPHAHHQHNSQIATYQLVAGIHAEQLQLEDANG